VQGGGLAAIAFNSLPSGGNSGAPPIVLIAGAMNWNNGEMYLHMNWWRE
jgi:hypothetical protein